MKVLHATLIAEKNKLATTSSWLPLIKVEISPEVTLLIVPNPAPIVFDSETYEPFPVEVGEVQQDTKGGLNDVQVILSNVDRTVTAFLETYEVRGRRVLVKYVNTSKLDDPSVFALEEIYEINGAAVQERTATFVLGHEQVLSHRVPAGRFQRDNCRWIYKTRQCGYTGTMVTCDQILNGPNGCRAHNNVPRFGGFPLLPKV